MSFGNGLWQVLAPKLCLRSVWEVQQGQKCVRTTRVRMAVVWCPGPCPGSACQHRYSHRLHPDKPLQAPSNAYPQHCGIKPERQMSTNSLYPKKRHQSPPRRDTWRYKTSLRHLTLHRALHQAATDNACRAIPPSTPSLDLTSTFPQVNRTKRGINWFGTHSWILPIPEHKRRLVEEDSHMALWVITSCYMN